MIEEPLHTFVGAAWLFGFGAALACGAWWHSARRWLWALAALCALRVADRWSQAFGYEGPIIDGLGIASAIAIVAFSVALLRASRSAPRLAREHIQMQNVFEAAGDGIWVLNEGGQTVAFNPAAAKMTGWAPHEIVGKVSHHVIHHSRADGKPYPIEECPIYHSVNEGRPCQVVEEVFWRKDGSSFPVSYSSTPILDDRGRRIGAVQVFRDVTDARAAEQQASRMREIEQRRRQAFEVNDTIVQHLVVADLALAMGRADEAAHSLQAGLGAAKRIINEWAGERPDQLVRNVPASSHAIGQRGSDV